LEQELEIATFCKFTECSKKRQDDTRQTQNSEICHGENFANSIFSITRLNDGNFNEA
jgi:hypothetical protein